jgi:hypothetical protein
VLGGDRGPDELTVLADLGLEMGLGYLPRPMQTDAARRLPSLCSLAEEIESPPVGADGALDVARAAKAVPHHEREDSHHCHPDDKGRRHERRQQLQSLTAPFNRTRRPSGTRGAASFDPPRARRPLSEEKPRQPR